MKKQILLLLVLVLAPMAVHADPLEKVAKTFAKKMRSMKNPRVALLGFPYHNGRISSGSSILSERLTTYMAGQKGVRVIERNLLKTLLEEQHLSATGIVDASAARKIGKVLDVDVIVTGTLNDLETEQTELNARALKAGSGEVIAASHVIVTRSWNDRPRNPNQALSCPLPMVDETDPPNEAIRIGIPGMRGGGGKR